MKSIEHIFWDWNGTLLNDVDLCVHVTSGILQDRHNKTLDKDTYLKEFGFPVVDFYKKVGIHLEDDQYASMAIQWIDSYKSSFPKFAALHNGVHQTIKELNDLGYPQSVLSACEINLLNHLIEKFELNFHSIHGVDDFHAHGKVELAHHAVKHVDLNAEKCLLIGDTIHDYEVAQEAGMQCLLIAHGHQHKNRLEETGCKVISQLSEISKLFI